MADAMRLTAIIEREGDGYFALCPEYDAASQGETIEEARANLIQALTLFSECADTVELNRRFLERHGLRDCASAAVTCDAVPYS